MPGDPTLARVFDEGKWAVGMCRSTGAAGAYVLLWPVGGRIWESSFGLDFERASSGELDTFIFSQDDPTSIAQLALLDIEWAPNSTIAHTVVSDQFPRSWAAGETIDESSSAPTASTGEAREDLRASVWGRWL